MDLGFPQKTRCPTHGGIWEQWLCADPSPLNADPKIASLPGSGQVGNCPRCSQDFEHFAQLQKRLRNLPRAELPAQCLQHPLLMATLAPTPEPLRSRDRRRRRKWSELPWGLRTTLEGGAIVGIILAVLLLGPQIRKLYDRSVDRSLEKYSDSLGVFSTDKIENSDPTDPNSPSSKIPLGRGKPLPSGGDAMDDYTSENGSEGEESISTEPATAGGPVSSRPEIWRFHIKSSSPRDLRKRVVDLLLSSGLTAETQGIGGVEAPGGIQFNLLFPATALARFRTEIEKLAPVKAAEGDSGSSLGETFTWIRSKSKTPLPQGKVRVVVWISQY